MTFSKSFISSKNIVFSHQQNGHNSRRVSLETIFRSSLVGLVGFSNILLPEVEVSLHEFLGEKSREKRRMCAHVTVCALVVGYLQSLFTLCKFTLSICFQYGNTILTRWMSLSDTFCFFHLQLNKILRFRQGGRGKVAQ